MGIDMHTPDGFLTDGICVLTFLISASAVVFSALKIRKSMTKQKVFLMAGLAATIFAFQMLNFSIGSGTSGHFIGAAIAAILLGPHAAVLILTFVLLVQTFLYADGGILALGANIFVMGIVASYSAYFTYQLLRKTHPLLGGIFASWISVVTASFVLALLLGISGTISFLDVIPAMVLTHIFIGIGESIITGSILLYIQKTKHTLLYKEPTSDLFHYIAFSTIGALVVTALALPFASESPDGLEKVALNLGFFEKAVEIYSFSPMPGYTFLGKETYLFVLASGVIGAVLTFALVYILINSLVPAQISAQAHISNEKKL